MNRNRGLGRRKLQAQCPRRCEGGVVFIAADINHKRNHAMATIRLIFRRLRDGAARGLTVSSLLESIRHCGAALRFCQRQYGRALP